MRNTGGPATDATSECTTGPPYRLFSHSAKSSLGTRLWNADCDKNPKIDYRIQTIGRRVSKIDCRVSKIDCRVSKIDYHVFKNRLSTLDRLSCFQNRVSCSIVVGRFPLIEFPKSIFGMQSISYSS